VIRLLFWAALAWLLVMGVRRLAGGDRSAGQGPRAPAAEDMVRCVACQVNLPKSEALAVPGGWACCAEHAGGPAQRP